MKARAAFPWLLLALLGAAPHAQAQARAGGEFLVNATTTGFQADSAVASDSRGNFIVVWSLDNVTSIVGQRFDRAAGRLGSEFVVDTVTAGVQIPAVAMNARGEFLVVWRQFAGASAVDIHGQAYDPSGVRIGVEFRLNDFTPKDQVAPSVAADGRGDFVVAWWSWTQDGSYDYAAIARKVSRQGVPLGTEVVVNTYTTGNQWFTHLQPERREPGLRTGRHAGDGLPR